MIWQSNNLVNDFIIQSLTHQDIKFQSINITKEDPHSGIYKIKLLRSLSDGLNSSSSLSKSPSLNATKSHLKDPIDCAKSRQYSLN